MAVWQPFKQGAALGREGMLGAVTGAVQPPDLPRRFGGGKRMQHGEHRSRAHSDGQQDYRCLAVGEEERPSRCGDVDPIAGLTWAWMYLLAAPCDSRFTLMR